MSRREHIALIDRLRAQPSETEWFEFKRSRCEPQRRRSFPLPDYDLTKPGQVAVTLTGRIVDERYTQLLMARTDLDLGQVMLLDRVQKGLPIARVDHRRLKDAGLVEGRYPNLIVAAAIARATGEAGRHVLERGFERQYYLDLILALVHEHGPVQRRDVDQTLVPKLPDRLSDKQKRRKVRNLLQELRRAGKIVNLGSRSEPRWAAAEETGKGQGEGRAEGDSEDHHD